MACGLPRGTTVTPNKATSFARYCSPRDALALRQRQFTRPAPGHPSRLLAALTIRQGPEINVEQTQAIVFANFGKFSPVLQIYCNRHAHGQDGIGNLNRLPPARSMWVGDASGGRRREGAGRTRLSVQLQAT